MRKLLFILCCLSPLLSFSQWTILSEAKKMATFSLSEVAILDIEPNNSAIILNLGAPNNSGERVRIITTNNKKWINFSSALAPSSSPRNVSIKIEDGSVPSGLYLKLKTSNYQGNGRGQLGNSTREITLNKTSQNIISNIGGAFTGNGINNGFELSYFLEIYDYKLLDFDKSETLTISLTLTDF
jgi:hypothetical protein